MLYLTILAVGTMKDDALRAAADDYKKMLGSYAKVEEICVKEEPIRNEENHTEVARALDREGEKILAMMPKDATRVALCVEGRQFSSEKFAAFLENAARETGKVCLVIGSSHGLSPKVKAACNLLLSVSEMTFPHRLLRVMLYEILYRAMTILSGKSYHK